jgi:hypothetical protein
LSNGSTKTDSRTILSVFNDIDTLQSLISDIGGNNYESSVDLDAQASRLDEVGSRAINAARDIRAIYTALNDTF